MPLEAATLLQPVALVTWTCLNGTAFHRKNPLFARFFTRLAVFEFIASAASLTFCPGLFEVLDAASPPTVEWFKSLPTDTKSRWAVYAVVLEKAQCRSKVYIGSGTSVSIGVAGRLKQYDDGLLLPVYVEKALDEGYTIVHKGLLCWNLIPPAALVPRYQLLIIALEATFAYMFWAMRPCFGDYGIAHICRWDHNTLEYDGACGHCCLDEGIRGDFDLSAERLEAQAAEKEKKCLEVKAQNTTNDHFNQMEENYDEYIGKAGERAARSRANNPGRDRLHQANRVSRALSAKTFYCDRCNLLFGTKQSLQNHKKTPKHKRKANESSNPFKCGPCNLGFHNQSNLTRHEKSDRHLWNLATAQSSSTLG